MNITFRCGHCNNLMAVTPNDVGKQVRCPTCQKVVIAPGAPAPVPAAVAAAPAPAPVPSPPAPPSFEISAPVEHESIFAPEAPRDDLFGDEPEVRVEMPPEPPRSTSPADFNLDSPAPPVEPAHVDVVENHTFPAAIPANDEPFQQPAQAPSSPWESDGASSAGSTETSFTPTVRKPSSGLSIPLLIVPLVSYAVLATILLLIVWKENRRLKYENISPLDQIPDVEGDNPGVKKGRVQITYPNPEEKLPDYLKTTVGKKITIGNLEFEPLKVTREHIYVESKGTIAEKEDDPSLVLHFRVKNLSSDHSFAPMDAYFYRLIKAGASDDIDSYTRLQIGQYTLIGGPAEWAPHGSKKLRETVRGQDTTKVLGPGESMTSFICTDPRKGKLDKMLTQNKGDMLWRIQLRRGLVEYESPYKGKRSVPACVVLGVTFNNSQISK